VQRVLRISYAISGKTSGGEQAPSLEYAVRGLSTRYERARLKGRDKHLAWRMIAITTDGGQHRSSRIRATSDAWRSALRKTRAFLRAPGASGPRCKGRQQRG
jgi:hypothetical protein